jgi:hypothetical protein
MKSLARSGVVVAITAAAVAVVLALTLPRYRASSTVRFTCDDCRVPENFAPIGLVKDSLGWPVNDVRSKLLKEVGPGSAVTIAALEATGDTSASVAISYDSVDADAAAREAARLAQRFRDIYIDEWQPTRRAPNESPVSMITRGRPWQWTISDPSRHS